MLDRLLDDLRFPIGLLFSIFAMILLGLGLFGSAGATGAGNLNLVAGGVMGLFGAFMLGTAWLSARRAGKQ